MDLVLVSHAIAYNNRAVGQYRVGNLGDAIRTLKDAVDCLRAVTFMTRPGFKNFAGDGASLNLGGGDHYLDHATRQHLDGSFSSFAHEGEHGAEHIVRKAITAVPTCRGSNFDDTDLARNDSFSFYEHAFLIHEVEQRQDIICAVIFYNLALARHQRNMNRGSNLQKVLPLYDNARALTQNLCASEDSVHLLLLAIGNNVMHIHSIMFDRPALLDSLARFKELVSALPSLDDEQFDFFVYSSIFFDSDPLQCAPAA
jgi:hypothetical protein